MPTKTAPLWKSVRIDPHPGGFDIVAGVGAAKRTIGSAPTMREAKAILKEQANRLKALDAEDRGNRWLADGNAAAEAGNKAKADRCYEKGQFWLDRYNHLAGNSDRPPTNRS